VQSKILKKLLHLTIFFFLQISFLLSTARVIDQIYNIENSILAVASGVTLILGLSLIFLIFFTRINLFKKIEPSANFKDFFTFILTLGLLLGLAHMESYRGNIAQAAVAELMGLSIALFLSLAGDEITDVILPNTSAKTIYTFESVDFEIVNKDMPLNNLAKFTEDIVRDDILGITIGINGAWGTGKSSLIKTIEKKLAVDNFTIKKIDSTNFFSSTSMIEFLKDSYVDIFFEEDSSSARRKISALVESSSDRVPYKHIFSLIFPPVSQENARQHIASLISNNKNRFLLVYDDLDRLNELELNTILRIVHRLTGIPKLTQILCYDRSRIEKMTSPIPTEINAQSFLSKYVNLEVHLPQFDDHRIRSIVIQTIEQYLSFHDSDISLNQTVRTTFHSNFFGLIDNHRDLNLFLFSFKNLVDKNIKYLYIEDAINITILKIKYPIAYSNLPTDLVKYRKNTRSIEKFKEANNINETHLAEILYETFPSIDNEYDDSYETRYPLFRVDDPTYFNLYFTKCHDSENILSVADLDNLRIILQQKLASKFDEVDEHLEEYSKARPKFINSLSKLVLSREVSIYSLYTFETVFRIRNSPSKYVDVAIEFYREMLHLYNDWALEALASLLSTKQLTHLEFKSFFAITRLYLASKDQQQFYLAETERLIKEKILFESKKFINLLSSEELKSLIKDFNIFLTPTAEEIHRSGNIDHKFLFSHSIGKLTKVTSAEDVLRAEKEIKALPSEIKAAYFSRFSSTKFLKSSVLLKLLTPDPSEDVI
jgi:hypothetical protein